MKKLFINFICALSLLPSAAATELCRNIPTPASGLDTIYIKGAGKHCLSSNLTQGKRYILAEGRYYNSGSILRVSSCSHLDCSSAEYYEIDLQNHQLRSKALNSSGISGSTKGMPLLIKNGSVFVPGDGNPRAANIGVSLIQHQPKESFICSPMGRGDCEDVSASEWTEKNPVFNKPNAYFDNEYKLENMNVEAGWRAVEIVGGRSVVRNSVLEVDSNTAIYILGHAPIIENNIIIVHNKINMNRENSKDHIVKVEGGAIKLRDAKGGIIRNNKIIYKGGFFSWGKAPVAINLLDSKDVLIENNTIIGFEKLVRENGDTSFTEKSNKFEQ